MTSLRLHNLTKIYAGQAAVDHIHLEVEHGHLVCLLGPSGCGKTTTLRLLAGFIEPEDGEIFVGERRVSAPGRTLPPEQRNMSMIFQSYALWPHMTIAENVAYGLKLRGLPKTDIDTRVVRVLSVVRMESMAQRYPSELSGGQQQRVALARALVVEPETLLLDEPLSNLDANLREEMRFEIRRLHDEFKYTTVYVTHDQSEAMTTADLIVVMNKGKIEQVGSPEDVYERPSSEFVARFIGGTNILRGRHRGGNLVEVDGRFALQCGHGEAADGRETAVSVRLPHIGIGTTAPQTPGQNTAPGRVLRQVYLGSTRDYLVELESGQQIRLATPTSTRIPPGEGVWLHFPPEHCRALSR